MRRSAGAPRAAVVDVLDWAARERSRRGAAEARWDLIVANLFLHHFEGAALAALLAAIDRAHRALLRLRAAPRAARARRQPSGRRARRQRGDARGRGAQRARRFSRTTSCRRCGPVHAGDWRLREYTAGLFSHCLRAERRSARVAGRAGATSRSRRADDGERAMNARCTRAGPRRRRGDRRRRPGRQLRGDPAGARRLVGRAGREAALPAPQGLRRVHRGEQPAAARCARRRRRGRLRRPARRCVASR